MARAADEIAIADTILRTLSRAEQDAPYSELSGAKKMERINATISLATVAGLNMERFAELVGIELRARR